MWCDVSGWVSGREEAVQRGWFFLLHRTLRGGAWGVFHRRRGVPSAMWGRVRLWWIQLHGLRRWPFPIHHRQNSRFKKKKKFSAGSCLCVGVLIVFVWLNVSLQITTCTFWSVSRTVLWSWRPPPGERNRSKISCRRILTTSSFPTITVWRVLNSSLSPDFQFFFLIRSHTSLTHIQMLLDVDWLLVIWTCSKSNNITRAPVCFFFFFVCPAAVYWLLCPCVSIPGEQYEKAIECAKTFLLFRPDDEVMNQNLAYYSVVLGEEKAVDITARQVLTHDMNIHLSFCSSQLQDSSFHCRRASFFPPKF